MSTTTTISCDINGCSAEATHKQKIVSVTFTTEQNEGRSTNPYLSKETLDFCDEHYQQYIDLQPLRASGAMGYNEFTLRSSNG